MKKGTKIFLALSAAIIIIAAVSFIFLIRNANRIAKHKLDQFLGNNFSVQEVRLKWNKVEALNVSYKNPEGKTVFHTDSLVLSSDFMGLFKKDYNVSSATLVNPYLMLEKDKEGAFKNPFPSQKDKNGNKPSSEFRIQKVEIINGSLDYIDDEVSGEPVITELRNIDIDSENIIFPIRNNLTDYRFTAKVSGKLSAGIIKSEGKIALKTFDMDSKVKAKNLDVTHFNPYFKKKSTVDIKRGFLDLDIDMKIISGKIIAPGRAVLSDLQFESESGTKAKFLKLPVHAIMAFLKDNKDRIAFDFTLEGDLDNPKFSLREGAVDKLTIGIAKKLGLPVESISESIVSLGAEGVGQIGKSVKGAGEEQKKVLK
jgi:hypothetical protein